MADETGGVWGAVQTIPALGTLDPNGNSQVWSVSCGSPGDCAAGGSYWDAENSDSQAFVVNEVGGVWGKVQQVPGLAALNIRGTSGLTSVSCPPTGFCSAAGAYTWPEGHQSAFVVNQAPVPSTVGSLSVSKVSYGDEQAERVSAAVSSAHGTPEGIVTVSANHTELCRMTLASGSGSCTLPAAGLPAGTAHLTASYSGSSELAPSVSAAMTLTVSKAATKTRLTLSHTRVAHGKERSERLRVVVTAQYGRIPHGKVVITARHGHGRARTICSVRLVAGKASCALPARKLVAGTYRLIARYLGGTDFTQSAAAARLEVVG